MHLSFDFDYTLADSSDGTVECANFAMLELGLPPCTPQAVKNTIGLSLERTFESLVGGRDVPLAREFARLFLLKADAVMLDHIRFYDCVEPILRGLKVDGHFLSIVSTKFESRITNALRRDGLDDCIDYVVGGDQVRAPKPDPEGLRKAMHASGVSAQETVYVGDSRSDGAAARFARVAFVGVLTGMTERAELEKWSPMCILSSLEGLTEVDWLRPTSEP